MDDIEKIWKQALKLIKDDIPHTSFVAWIKPARLKDFVGNTATLQVSNEFCCNLIKQNYLGALVSGLSKVIGGEVNLNIIVDTESLIRDYTPTFSSIASEDEMNKTKLHSASVATVQAVAAMNPRYTFENFIVGSHNQFCHAAALAIAAAPSAGVYNPLFIYGGVGLGKTHIMQAIGHHVLAHSKHIAVVYLTAENFLNDMIDAMRKQKMKDFRGRYRSAGLLLIDDIQFIEGKDGTQEEFFHTFNALKDSGSQIVLTSDRPPKSIPRLEPRLCSRFEGGLVADIQPPGYEIRLAIVQRKAADLGLHLAPALAGLVAEHFTDSVRKLEGALIKLQAYVNFTGEKLEVSTFERLFGLNLQPQNAPANYIASPLEAEETLGRVGGGSNASGEILDKIANAVIVEYGITMAELRGRDNTGKLRLARQMAIYLAREAGVSLLGIGRFFGRGNSSLLNAHQRVKASVSSDAQVANVAKKISSNIQI